MSYSFDQEKLMDLNAAMDVCGELMRSRIPAIQVAGLHLMALSVGRYPPGLLQDLAEDILSSCIADLEPSAAVVGDLRTIRLTLNFQT
jgi:hypothetical protein